jgi:hypothetical protein
LIEELFDAEREVARSADAVMIALRIGDTGTATVTQLLGSFGPLTVSLPRAMRQVPNGKTEEWQTWPISAA